MIRPITVAHVIVGLDVGGAERFLLRLVGAHRDNPAYRHRVISLTTPGALAPRLEEMGVRVEALGMRTLLDAPRTGLRLRRILRRERPDVLQCWMYYADLLGGLAGRSLGMRRILWGIRNSHFESGGTRLKRAVRKTCALCSHVLPERIVCVADSARAVHAAAGYDASRMQVIHNGYDPAELVFSQKDRDRLRRQLGLGADDIAVCSLGRYSAAKDHAGFIEAAGIAARSHPRLRFLMVGRGLEPGNAEVARRIGATGLAERFLLLGERRDVAACLSAADVFCLHSRTEGFPNVLGEAMCVGLPCVATDVGDARVLLGETGLLVPPGDPAALAAALRRMAGMDSCRRGRMGRLARQRVQAHFTLAHAVGKFEALYQAPQAQARPAS